jgi:hypothetical protein
MNRTFFPQGLFSLDFDGKRAFFLALLEIREPLAQLVRALP